MNTTSSAIRPWICFSAEPDGYDSAPDIVVHGDKISAPNFAPLGSVVLECDVVNESNCATPADTLIVVAFDVYHGDGSHSATLHDTLGQISAWGSSTASVEWSASADSMGHYDIWVSADIDSSVTEISDGNNSSCDTEGMDVYCFASGFPIELDQDPGTSKEMILQDLDGDGDLEFVYQYNDNWGTTIGTVVRDLSGQEWWSFEKTVTHPCNWFCPVVADVDLDGKPEIVTVVADVLYANADSIFVLNSEETLSGESRIWSRSATGELHSSPLLIDVDPVDGRPEVVVVDTTGPSDVRSLYGISAAILQTSAAASAGRFQLHENTYPSCLPVVVDQGLRAPSLVWWDIATEPAVLLCVAADGETLWTYEASLADSGGQASPGHVAAGDLDRDGDVEVAATLSGSEGRLYVLDSLDGALDWSSSGVPEDGYLAIGNLDSGDDLEVVVCGASGDSGTVVVFDDGGTLLWSKSLTGDVSSEPLLGDFDGGSDVEIVVGIGARPGA